MKIEVLLFAGAREAMGGDRVEVTTEDVATVGTLRRCLGEQYPALRPWLSRMMIAVNAEYADDAQVLTPGAEVAGIPPVSGGGQTP